MLARHLAPAAVLAAVLLRFGCAAPRLAPGHPAARPGALAGIESAASRRAAQPRRGGGPVPRRAQRRPHRRDPPHRHPPSDQPVGRCASRPRAWRRGARRLNEAHQRWAQDEAAAVRPGAMPSRPPPSSAPRQTPNATAAACPTPTRSGPTAAILRLPYRHPASRPTAASAGGSRSALRGVPPAGRRGRPLHRQAHAFPDGAAQACSHWLRIRFTSRVLQTCPVGSVASSRGAQMRRPCRRPRAGWSHG